MLIKSNKDKLDVEITIKNQKDNAYNTKVILNFSPNINYVTAKVSCVKLLSLFLVLFWCSSLMVGLVLSQEDCTLNHTKVECTVGYPFLGSNKEVRYILFHKINATTRLQVLISLHQITSPSPCVHLCRSISE